MSILKAKNKKLALVFLAVFINIAVFSLFSIVQAKNCGGETACACGDTVTASTALTANLTCAGQALIVGADNITIDGGGYTMTGDGGVNDYGINNSGGYDNITIQNFGNITNFNKGIYFLNSESNSIENNTANSNSYGIYISVGWAERQPAGDADKNWYSVASNSDGSNLIAAVYGGRLYTSSDSGTTWTERQPAGATNKFWQTVASDSDGSNLIAAVYGGRLYTSSDSGATWIQRQPAGDIDKNWRTVASDSDGSNLIAAVYGGRLYTSSNSGATWTERQPAKDVDKNWWTVASDSDGSNLIAAVYGGRLYISDNYGIYSSSSSNTLTNNTADSNTNSGIYVFSSSSNTLTSNTASSNTNSGIYLYRSDSNTLTNNTTNSNTNSGIYLYHSDSNTLTNNIANSNSGSSLTQGGNQVYSLGIYLRYSSNNYLGLDDTPGSGNTANSNSNTGVYIHNGSDNHLNYNTTNLNNKWGILTYQSNSNTFTGNTANSNGSYGIQLDAAIGGTISGNTANSNGMDGIYLYLFSNTTITNNTVQNNSFTGIRIRHSSTGNTVTGNTIESNRYGIYFSDNSGNSFTSNTVAGNEYDIFNDSGNTFSSNSFSYNATSTMLTFTDVTRTKNLNETITFNTSMLDASGNACSACAYTVTTNPVEEVTTNKTDNNLSSSFVPTRPGSYSLIFTITDPTNSNVSKKKFLFFVDVSSSHITTSNDDIIILSATAPASDTDDISIIIENPLSVAASTSLVLSGSERPFLNATSTIDSTATTTISTPTISANATSTFDSVPMDITPSSGSIAVYINTWNTSGNYSKEWTETDSTSGITATHTVGDLKNNTPYAVKVNGTSFTGAVSNGSGQITFTYDGGCSEKTFEVEEDTVSPGAFSLSSPNNNLQTSNNPPTFSWQASSDSGSGLAKYQLYIDGSLVTDNISNTSIALTNSLSCSTHTWYVAAVDNADNSTNSDSFSLVITCLRPPSSHRHIEEKVVKEMTIEELEAKIIEIQKQIIELLTQLIQLIQGQINDIQR